MGSRCGLYTHRNLLPRARQLAHDDVMAFFIMVWLFTNLGIGVVIEVVDNHLNEDCTLGSRTFLLVGREYWNIVAIF